MEHSHNNDTPKKRIMGEERSVSTPNKLFPRYLLLSNNSSFTPSPCRRTVRNPFENQLHERLHLPVISDSPTLFQTIRTPKHQFEWTIDELSSLNPINLVPHETQFREEMDPVLEAQAQDAISSFFKEHKIVPSPIDCSLRKQRIVLKSETNSLKIINSTANACSKAYMLTMPQTREIASQTALTLPPELPKEVEDLLMKYNIIYSNDKTQSCEKETLDTTSQSNQSMMDVSTLRRKLFINRPTTPSDGYAFDNSNLNLSPAPRTPELTKSCDVLDGEASKNDSFGSEPDNFDWQLSPIRAFSPANLSSNDVSMLSENGHDKTPSRGQGCKKPKGKNLHSSFCLIMQNSSDDLHGEEFLPAESIKGPVTKQTFRRFDSGFPADDEESKLSVENMSDIMQF